MDKFYTLDDVEIQGKRVVLRLDMNVPIKDGKILDPTRIQKALPTIQYLIQNKAAVFILSHLGRPNGEYVETLSLLPIANYLEEALQQKIYFASKEPIMNIHAGEIALLENIRFHPGEESNDPELAKFYASIGDLYINDAFSVSHRAHASVEAITKFIPSIAGPQLSQEVAQLRSILTNPEKPVMAIVGGSKISTKIALLENLVKNVDILAPVGGIANTFLKAQGMHTYKSLVEDNCLATAQHILDVAKEYNCRIFLPHDVVVADSLSGVPTCCLVTQIPIGSMILDMGQSSLDQLCVLAIQCKTVVWNGPLGACEIQPFDHASLQLAVQLAQHPGVTIAGGGETIMMLQQANVMEKLSYVSTAGGAFLEFLEGTNLPGIGALQQTI